MIFRFVDTNDGCMQSLASRIAVATASALISAVLGGCIGFIVARILVEGFNVVEGPPAGVLLVMSVAGIALIGAAVGFILTFRWFRTGRADAP